MSFAGNKPIYALSSALGAAIIILGIVSVSALTSLENPKDGSTAFVENQHEKTITVTGTAMSTIEPDKVQVSLGVDTTAGTAQDAVRLNAERMQKVIEAAKALGIEEKEISTSNFSVYPTYSRGSFPNITGFTTSNRVTVPASNDIPAAKVIDVAIQAGVNRVDNVNFGISQELGAKLWEQTVANAISDARVKAEKILAPMDMKIVGVKSITPDYTPYPLYHRGVQAMLGGGVAAVPTPIFITGQEFWVNVSITFLIA